MRFRQALWAIVTVSPLLILGACGGGGDDTAAGAAGRVPASVLASVETFTRWVAGLAADDRAEPLSLTDTTLPVSDTDEPVDVD